MRARMSADASTFACNRAIQPAASRRSNCSDKRAPTNQYRVGNGRPFPTLYWLVGARLSLQLDRLEAAGWIARLQAKVDASADIRARMLEDHKRHKAQRARFMMPAS